MLQFSKSLFEIESYNHLVARLLDGNKALDTAKNDRKRFDYATQCNHHFCLFKFLAVSQRQLAEV